MHVCVYVEWRRGKEGVGGGGSISVVKNVIYVYCEVPVNVAINQGTLEDEIRCPCVKIISGTKELMHS